MAKQVKDMKIQTEVAQEQEPVQESLQQGDPEQVTLLPPFQQIGIAMGDVAAGGGAPPLRKLVLDLFPEDQEEAAKFMAACVRIRNSGEVVLQAAQEAMFRLMNR